MNKSRRRIEKICQTSISNVVEWVGAVYGKNERACKLSEKYVVVLLEKSTSEHFPCLVALLVEDGLWAGSTNESKASLNTTLFWQAVKRFSGR